MYSQRFERPEITREREASDDKYSRRAFKGIKSQASRASASVLKTRGLRAIGHGMLSGRWISTRRKKEKASEKDPDYPSIEICNRYSLSSLSPLIIDAILASARRISPSILSFR